MCYIVRKDNIHAVHIFAYILFGDILEGQKLSNHQIFES